MVRCPSLVLMYSFTQTHLCGNLSPVDGGVDMPAFKRHDIQHMNACLCEVGQASCAGSPGEAHAGSMGWVE